VQGVNRWSAVGLAVGCVVLLVGETYLAFDKTKKKKDSVTRFTLISRTCVQLVCFVWWVLLCRLQIIPLCNGHYTPLVHSHSWFEYIS